MGLLKKINKIIFINVGGRKEKLLFLFVFSTYLPVFLLKFRSGDLVGCGILELKIPHPMSTQWAYC